MEVLNVWCSLLHFCLLSLIQTTSQWIRIYCCFVFWEKTVAWEKIPKSAVWAPHAAPLASQMCCHRWALHWWGWASCLHRWSDQILTCCTKPIHQVLPFCGIFVGKLNEVELFCRYRIWNISSELNFIYTRTVMTRFKVKFWCVAN